MKNINKKILATTTVILLLFSVGCKKALEEKVFSFISSKDFYKNESDAVAAVNAIYSELYTYDLFIQPFWNLTMMDDDHVSGADWYLGTAGAGNPQAYWGIDGPWKGCYTIISRANTVLENVPGITGNINETVKKRVLGEAYFFRGWAYFQLVQLYGPVPIRLKSLAVDPNANIPRSPVKDVYDVVIADLKNAETMLLPSTDANAGGAGRVTKAVASAFLAKAYLYIASASLPNATVKVRGGNDNSYYNHTKTIVAGYESFNSADYFKLARDKSAEIIAAYKTAYPLFTDWKDIFTKANRNKGEHMWEIQSLAGTDFTNDMHSYFTAGSIAFGRGAVWTTNDHYKNYETTDTRVIDGISHHHKVWGYWLYYPSWESATYGGTSPEGYPYYNDGSSHDIAFVTKYSDVSDPALGKSDAFYPMLRFSEILLMFAEAENEVNAGSANAYSALNAVRSRAQASNAPEGMGKEDFRSFVIEERGREFTLESSIRHFDLLRWGIYLSVMNKITVQQNNINKQRTLRNLLLPIPQDELNSNKAITSNNPGW